MALTLKDVEKIALLARLELSPEEKDLFTKQLDEILAFAAKLNQLDTAKVEPTTHVLSLNTAWREDEVKTFDNIPGIMANVPQPEGDFFGVPKILGS